MPPLPQSLDAITLFVDDPQRSKAFYADVLALEPIHEDDDSVAFRLENLVPWGVRTAAFADPDGHVWEVARRL